MMVARTSTLTIRTPEGVDFALQLASPVSRFMAWAIDLACVGAASSILGTAMIFLNMLSIDLAQAVSTLLFFILQISYGFCCEWFWRGQTVGKRMLRLRVVDASGLRLQFSQIVTRNLLRFVDMLPAFYLVGGVTTLLNSRSQRLGDIAANTIVIRAPKIEEPDLEKVLAGKFNSLRQHPHLEGRLRQRVSPVEASIALQAVLRRDEFEPDKRAQLFAKLADHFRSLVDFPPDAVEGITDEQYIRNVVDVVFRPRGARVQSVSVVAQNA
jgi:uncharacterized RDD family membrane protein YckC